MGIVELLVIAVGLGMDAFAIAICKGLSIKKIELKHMLIVGAYFGGFQALMPTIGYLLGFGFYQKIEFLDHWIAFILLSLIGIITFILSVIGVKIGNIYGRKYQKKACIFGGIVLILLGIKIFFEHLGIINF